MAKKKKEEQVDLLGQVSQFVAYRKDVYLQELRESNTEVERFIWSEMIGLLDEISGLLDPPSL